MITIENLSDWPDTLLKEALSFANPAGLEDGKLIVTDVWFNFENHLVNGKITDLNPNVEWDGLAFTEDGVAYSHLSPKAVFPLVWWVNHNFTNSYQRGMVLFSPMEYFVYNFAHELRHLWQNDNRETQWLGELFDGVEDFDEEMDADLHAIIKLNKYRRASSFVDYNNRP